MTKIKLALFLFVSLIFCGKGPHTVWANGTSGKLEALIPTVDRAVIAGIVRHMKKTERGMKSLKAEYYQRAFVIGALCRGKRLYLLTDNDLDVPDDVLQNDERGFPNVGSGGPHVRVFLEEGRNKFRLVLSDVLIDILGYQKHGNCPDLIVELHGSAFNRAGGDYGVGRLRFTNGSYVPLTKKGKTVEETSQWSR